MEKLKVGEKYLTIKLVGHDYVAAFKNKDKKGKEPDYKGDGVAIWIVEKKETKNTNENLKVTREDL